MALWSIVAYILVFAVIENVTSSTSEAEPASEIVPAINDVPLSKSLGFGIRKNNGKTLEDARIGEEYIALYNEMLKASQETVGKFGDGNAFGVGTDLTRLKGMVDRRRSGRMMIGSSVRQRRARSQALRREKLNSQSLRSHMEHSRHSSLEQRML